MSIPRLVIVAFALLAAACGANVTGPPDILVDRTACSHCGMFVSEPVYAAAYQVPGKEARVFDDIGCMLGALRGESSMPAGVWVQDAAGGGWLAADDATFVASSRIRSPMSGGLLAYADAAAAEKAAATYRGDVRHSLEELIATNGDAR
jgi:nitrous oxide reductase accessory protein NosL